MEPSPHQPTCTTHFPLYELHQEAHGAADKMTTPSTMDILCDIVSSEYSDTCYYMSSPSNVGVAGLAAHQAHPQQHDKESFSNILYSSVSKAMEIVDNEEERIHEQHLAYNSHYSHIPAVTAKLSTEMAFSASDMHLFKLPLLEQEPETSITNSQIDEEVKHKEIRRNLERCMLMQQLGSGACSANQLQSTCLGTMLSSEGEVKVHVERQDYENVASGMVNKGSISSLKLLPPINDEEEKHMECSSDAIKGINDEAIERRPANNYHFDEVKLLKRKATSANVNLMNGELSGSCKKAHALQSSTRIAKHNHNIAWEEAEPGSGTRVESPLAARGHRKKARADSLPGKSGQETRVAGGTGGVATPAASVAAAAVARLVSQETGINSGVKGAAASSSTTTTHISVERNRRKQMNEHLAILRSLMPASYVQRCDQASIIGGVVEFIKELQHLLASLETQKRRRVYAAEALSPRISTGSGGPSPRGSIVNQLNLPCATTQELVATSRSPLADVEVKLMGGAHVLLRTLSHKATHGQLLHLIAALECMSLEILHLNITTLQQSILYTFTLKIGIECRLSVDDLADVGQQIFKDIHARRL